MAVRVEPGEGPPGLGGSGAPDDDQCGESCVQDETLEVTEGSRVLSSFDEEFRKFRDRVDRDEGKVKSRK